MHRRILGDGRAAAFHSPSNAQLIGRISPAAIAAKMISGLS
jgi:hypothetical protein